MGLQYQSRSVGTYQGLESNLMLVFRTTGQTPQMFGILASQSNPSWNQTVGWRREMEKLFGELRLRFANRATVDTSRRESSVPPLIRILKLCIE